MLLSLNLGGITSSESMASGVPIIAINPIPGQEEENAEFLEKNNLAVWIKKEDNIEEVLKETLNNEKTLKTLKENVKKQARPNSASDICNIILKKL